MSTAVRTPEALLRAEEWLEWQREAREGDRTRVSQDARGDVVRIEERDGSWAEFDYDAGRRLIGSRRSAAGESAVRTVRFAYNDSDRLVEVNDGGVLHRYEYGACGRLERTSRGNAGGSVYRYDEAGRVVEMRTSAVGSTQAFDETGRVRAISQTFEGIAVGVELAYDGDGRLETLTYPGGSVARYTWTERGWPLAVAFDAETIAQWSYEPARRAATVAFANGARELSVADEVDARPVWREWFQGERSLGAAAYEYNARGQMTGDGDRTYSYSPEGFLASARCSRTGVAWTYQYDECGSPVDEDVPLSLRDECGRVEFTRAHGRARTFRYDDLHRLVEVLDAGVPLARLTYDAKGRLAVLRRESSVERYVYGPADELLAVTDAAGTPLRLWIRTPGAICAEVRFENGGPVVYALHQDARGTTRFVTSNQGAAALEYDPFGTPLSGDATWACFHGRVWFADLGLYYFGARWYDPALRSFLTPDSYTAAPDDPRIVNPLSSGTAQVAARAAVLGYWLRHPLLRNRTMFCGNDPVNNTDPNGHWSFFGVLLSVLLAIWTLPNTLFGLLIEITCIIGEGIRLLLSLISGGSVDWESIGFDAAASGRLNAFALVFEGGWIGSFSSLLGITFGNVFFVYKQWRTHPHITSPATVSPAAYGGTVTFPRSEALYEHELRHTNQYGWFGPFFHLGLPIFGIYEWDIILNGYGNSWLERDAHDYGGL